MLSCSVESDSVTPWAVACQRSLVHGDSPGQNTGVGCLSLPQGFFPTQGSNPGLPPCRRILYCLSHQGSPRILQWVAYPFSRDLPDPGIEPRSPMLIYQLSYEGSHHASEVPINISPLLKAFPDCSTDPLLCFGLF